MKIAIVGSRKVKIGNIGDYITVCDEIVSGGARGIDSCAAAYAREKGITLVEIFPDYARYGRAAPIIRNKEIVDRADVVLAFWDGRSKGTAWVIRYAKKTGKPCEVILCAAAGEE